MPPASIATTRKRALSKGLVAQAMTNICNPW